MSLCLRLGVSLLCAVLFANLGFAVAPRLSNRELIDRLMLVSHSDYGYSPKANGSIFPPLDSEGEFLGGMLFQAPPTPSETMRALVRRGVSAVPHLVAHLNDKRPTRVVIEAPTLVVGVPDGRKPGHSGSYTVTVGDLCYVALGQIINRDHAVVSYIPSGHIMVSPIASQPKEMTNLTRKWGKVTPALHKASLLRDVHRVADEARRIGALKRLAWYYPDALEPIALKLLEMPITPAEKARLIRKALIYDESKKLDRTIRDLLNSTTDDYLAESCMERLVSRGYDDDIERYCKKRLPLLKERDKEPFKNALDRLGWTPLHVAVSRGRADLAAGLLAGGSRSDAPSRNGETPLHLAAGVGNESLLALLLSGKVDLDGKDRDGLTAVQRAVRGDHDGVVLLLIRRGCALPDVLVATIAGRADLVARFVRDNPADIDAKTESGRTALFLAARYGRTAVLRTLLDAKDDANRSLHEIRPLRIAAALGHAAAAKVLLERGAEVDARPKVRRDTALHLAAHAGHLEVVRLLLAKRARMDLEDRDGRSPLYRAVQQGHEEVVRLLLKHKAPPGRITETGSVPLCAAVVVGRTALVKLLLAAGADPNQLDFWTGGTALHQAVRLGKQDALPTIRLLLERKANPVSKDEHGVTPLDIAQEIKFTRAIELLSKRAAK